MYKELYGENNLGKSVKTVHSYDMEISVLMKVYFTFHAVCVIIYNNFNQNQYVH